MTYIVAFGLGGLAMMVLGDTRVSTSSGTVAPFEVVKCVPVARNLVLGFAGDVHRGLLTRSALLNEWIGAQGRSVTDEVEPMEFFEAMHAHSLASPHVYEKLQEASAPPCTLVLAGVGKHPTTQRYGTFCHGLAMPITTNGIPGPRPADDKGLLQVGEGAGVLEYKQAAEQLQESANRLMRTARRPPTTNELRLLVMNILETEILKKPITSVGSHLLAILLQAGRPADFLSLRQAPGESMIWNLTQYMEAQKQDIQWLGSEG